MIPPDLGALAVGFVWVALTLFVIGYKLAALRRVSGLKMFIHPDDPPEVMRDVQGKIAVLQLLVLKEVPFLMAGVYSMVPPYPVTEGGLTKRAVLSGLIFMAQVISMFAARRFARYARGDD